MARLDHPISTSQVLGKQLGLGLLPSFLNAGNFTLLCKQHEFAALTLRLPNKAIKIFYSFLYLFFPSLYQEGTQDLKPSLQMFYL